MRAFLAACVLATGAIAQECANKAVVQPDYTAVLALERSSSVASQLSLPGATRSVHTHNYAIVAPESRVWADNEAWVGCKTAHILSNSISKFSMFFVQMKVREAILMSLCMTSTAHLAPCGASTAHLAPCAAACDC